MLRRVYSRFAYESFRQPPVRQLLKSFHVRVGSVPQLLLPDQLLKERGIHMRIALFCIMAERTKHIHAQRSFRFLAKRHKTLANGTLAKRPVTLRR